MARFWNRQMLESWKEPFKDDGEVRFTVIMAVWSAILVLAGLFFKAQIITFLGLIFAILFLSPRVSRHGQGYMKKIQAAFFAQVKMDQTPKMPLAKACLAVLAIGCPFYLFWILSAIFLLYGNFYIFLIVAFPILFISIVSFQSVKWRWTELDGKKWMFWAYQLLIFFACIGVVALVKLLT